MPRLTIYDDGYVFVGDPKGLNKSKSINKSHLTYVKGKISETKLKALMQFIVEKQDICNINTKEIEKYQNKYPVRMDADTTTFKITTSKGNHQIRVYDLKSKKNSKFQPYKKLTKIVSDLEKLRKEIIEQAK
jgi:hypothetical protein